MSAHWGGKAGRSSYQGPTRNAEVNATAGLPGELTSWAQWDSSSIYIDYNYSKTSKT
jgi:hypothetical protein